MVNAELKSCGAVLLLAFGVLTAIATLRGAEYDEQYTLFLTAGVARPVWPQAVFAAGEVRALQAGHASLIAIARDLRTTDVHPPLYFWAVALWRRLVGSGLVGSGLFGSGLFGSGLLAARLLSVVCGVAALAAVGVVARRTGVPAVPAMLLTLGCYGFAYTGAVARGFALAQAMTLCGVATLLSGGGRRRSMVGGMLLGAATFANYLAVFVAAVAVVAAGRHHQNGYGNGRNGNSSKGNNTPPPLEGAGWGERCEQRRAPAVGTPPPDPLPQEEGGVSLIVVAPVPAPVPALAGTAAGFLPFLLADLWFFLAQRNTRTGQFPPFHLPQALPRLARYAVANLFGGLPLYVPAPAQRLTALALALLALACAGLIAARWRRIAASAAARRLLLAAALAPPVGLLALGAVFDNTPIELRYLAFAVPFATLLLAGALATSAAPLAPCRHCFAADRAGRLPGRHDDPPRDDAARPRHRRRGVPPRRRRHRAGSARQRRGRHRRRLRH